MMSATVTRSSDPKSRRRNAVGVGPRSVLAMSEQVFEDDLHARTVLSLSTGVVGVLEAATLGIHAIGRGLAAAKGLNRKHTTKQIDRLLSNGKLNLWRLFASWVKFVIGPRTELVIAMDWTEFDADDQATLALYLITRHGRATPLVWHTAYSGAT
jgi:hypothetical protein